VCWRLAATAVLVFALSACSDDTSAGIPDAATDASLDGDAGVDAAPDTSVTAPVPMAPAPPALPVLTPCPDGWREVDHGDGLITCDPWPESGYSACASGETHFPGEPACTRIGTACPTGDYPEALPPGGPVIYVLASATGRQDGTIANPYASVQAAVDAAADGAVLAIGKGRYDEALVTTSAVTLVGACPAETVLTSSEATPGFDGTVLVAGAGVEIRNLTIADSARLGVVVDGTGSSVHLEDVALRSVEGYGIFVWPENVLTARSLLVADTRPYAVGHPREGTRGRGMQAVFGGRAEISRGVFVRNHDTGVNAFGGDVLLEDVAVLETQSQVLDGQFGAAFEAQQGGRLEARRVTFEGSHLRGGAFFAATGRFEDVVIRGTRGRMLDGFLGWGVEVARSSDVEFTRVWFEDNLELGILGGGPGYRLSLTDTVVRHVGTGVDGTLGAGIWVQGYETTSPLGPGEVNLERVWVSDTATIGVGAIGGNVSARITDTTIRATGLTGGDSTGSGAGLEVADGAFVSAERLLVEDAAAMGILVQGNRGGASEGTTGGTNRAELILRDTTVRSTRSIGADGTLGRGLHVEFGLVNGERVRFEGNREVTLMAFSSRVTLSDLTIADTLVAECGDSCPVDGFGHGFVMGPRSTVTIDVFEIATSPVCGVMVAGDGRLSLSRGSVSGAEIGVCILVEGFDLNQVSDAVIYRSNGLNLDSPALPVPDFLASE
jgi:hypothetical protein